MILTGVRVGDDPAAWRAAGFLVDGDDLVLDGFTIECGADDSPPTWFVLGDDVPSDMDGIATTPGEPPGDRPDHPNGVAGVDHVVVASPDLDRTQAAFERLGVRCRRVRDAGTDVRPMQQRFFRMGPVIVEVVGTPGATGDGPSSIWGLALITSDLDASAQALGPACGASKDAVQPGRRIATVRTRDLGISLPVALMTP